MGNLIVKKDKQTKCAVCGEIGVKSKMIKKKSKQYMHIECFMQEPDEELIIADIN